MEGYLIVSSYGAYEDQRDVNDSIVYLSKEAAENRKKEIEESINLTPFPFDYCTEEEFEELLMEDKVVQEDLDIYYVWYWDNIHKSDFNSCWIETLEII